MSQIKATTLSNLAGSQTVPMDTVAQGSSKAWVNFNGTGTVAIRRAFNVSSITDNGTGDYTVNFTNAMVDANYAVNVTARGHNDVDANSTIGGSGVITTSSARVFTKNGANALVDSSAVSVAIFS